MKRWSADELAELRAAFAGFGMSAEAIDAQLRVLDNIATSWAEQSHGLSSISLTLSQRANYYFAEKDDSVAVQGYRRVKRVASADKAATQTSEPKGPSLP